MEVSYNERWERGNTHSGWCLEDRLELSHTLVGSIDAECALYFGRYAKEGEPQRGESRVRHRSVDARFKKKVKEPSLTILL